MRTSAFVESLRDLQFIRCPIPSGAINPKKMIIWLTSDHAEVAMIAAYAGYELEDGSFSCTLLMGKNLLPPEGWTTPMGELHALSAAGNIKVLLEKALDGWVGEVLAGSDSEIALMWVQHEHLKLGVFQRNRVINARSKLDLDKVYHVLCSPSSL